MGYRPDLTHRLEVTVPWPFWHDEFMSEADLVERLKVFAKRLAAELPVVVTLNCKDNMIDMEPYRDCQLAMEEASVPDELIKLALNLDSSIWRIGRETFDERHTLEEKKLEERCAAEDAKRNEQRVHSAFMTAVVQKLEERRAAQESGHD
jgi:tRNA A37 threonylcarbamoyladenosine modification protein TsaB